MRNNQKNETCTTKAWEYDLLDLKVSVLTEKRCVYNSKAHQNLTYWKHGQSSSYSTEINWQNSSVYELMLDLIGKSLTKTLQGCGLSSVTQLVQSWST